MELRRDPITQSWVMQQMTRIVGPKTESVLFVPAMKRCARRISMSIRLPQRTGKFASFRTGIPLTKLKETPREKLRVFTTRCATWALTRW